MAKLKDMFNEVAAVIKTEILQKYLLHMHRFKKGKKEKNSRLIGEGMSSRGDKSEKTRTGTHNEVSSASNSSKTGLWRRKSLLDVHSKRTIIWARLAELSTWQYSINFTTEHF